MKLSKDFDYGPSFSCPHCDNAVQVTTDEGKALAFREPNHGDTEGPCPYCGTPIFVEWTPSLRYKSVTVENLNKAVAASRRNP